MLYYEQKIKRHVGGVKGVKHCTVPIKDQRLCMSEVSKVVFVTFTQHCIQSNVTHVGGVEIAYRAPQYKAMLLMSKVSKVHTGLSIQSNVTHVKGVESSSIYTIRAVMLCMSKVSKEAQNHLTDLCS